MTAAQIQLDQAVASLQAGRLDQARLICEDLVKRVPRQPDALHILGIVAHQEGRLDDARRLIVKAIANGPPSAVFHTNLGNVLKDLQRSEAAIEQYDRAIALRPDLAATHFNRALALEDLGRYEQAVGAYDAALALLPDLVAGLFHRAAVLARLSRTAEARAGFQHVLRLDPEHPEARKGILWLEIREPTPRVELEALVEEICAVTAAREAQALAVRKTVPAFRVRHDLEQAAWLLAQGREDFRPLHDTLQAVEARHPEDGEFTLTDAEVAVLNRARSPVLRQEVGADVAECLNPENDWTALEAEYLSGRPEMVVVDNLLTQSALLALREFCLGSTVWRSEYDNHYLGAFAGDGFLNPLMLRIAEEFQAKMPRMFSGQPLEQLWAFKYDSRLRRGINVHADFARVNVNFWITPDKANLDPASGGLVVYDAPAPRTWSFQEYNNDSKRIYDFLKASKAKKRVAPYRCNRAVIFNSNLFHETDKIRFREGYENRRINVTYLFGQREA